MTKDIPDYMRGFDLDEDYRQNDTGYCEEYIGVI